MFAGKKECECCIKLNQHLYFIFLSELAYSCAYRYSASAFVFSLVNKPGWAPVKLSQTRQSISDPLSTYSCSRYGPTFGGGHAIYIASYASSNKNSYSNPGYTYSPPSGHSYRSEERRVGKECRSRWSPDH